MKNRFLLRVVGGFFCVLGLNSNQVHAQVYCTPAVSDCSLSDEISNVTFAGINSNSVCGADGYENYTAQSGVVSAGMSYPFSITVGEGGNEAIAVWIDYNQNETFELSEYAYIGNLEGGTISSTISIPVDALGGSTRMRVRSFYMEDTDDPTFIYTVAGASCDEIGLNYGETEDYTINVTAAPACAGVPATLTASASASLVCSSSPLILTTNASPQTGLTFQWQSSTNGTTWTNIGAAQMSGTYDATGQTVTMQYRVTLTCTNTSTSVVSNVVTVQQNPITDCYCEPTLDCTDNDVITNVTFGSVNNNSTCGVNGYTDFTNLAAVEVSTLNTYPISITVGNGWNSESVSVWIDYNQNGQFELTEFTYIGTGSGSVVSGLLTIPVTAEEGNTRMRVRVAAVGGDGATADLACDGEQVYGETEDYLLNITDAIDCSGVPAAVTLSASETIVCEETPLVLSASGIQQSGYTYLWESSTSGTNWTALGTATTLSYFDAVGQTEAMQYRVTLTCINSSSSVVSNIITVNQTVFTDCICIPVLDCSDNDAITNVTFGALNQTSACGVNGYTDYTNLTPVEINRTMTYPIAVTVGDGWETESVSVWIDYNHNGKFETSEFTYIGTGSASVVNGSIVIPASAELGNTIMRVRVTWVEAELATGDLACDELQEYGETEDYMVKINSGVGINELNSELDLNVFPNPTSNVVTIQSAKEHGAMRYRVTDIAGTTLEEGNLNANELKSGIQVGLGSFANGMYFIQLEGENSTVTRSVVKK